MAKRHSIKNWFSEQLCNPWHKHNSRVTVPVVCLRTITIRATPWAASVGKRFALLNANPAPTVKNLKKKAPVRDKNRAIFLLKVWTQTFVSKAELRSIEKTPVETMLRRKWLGRMSDNSFQTSRKVRRAETVPSGSFLSVWFAYS